MEETVMDKIREHFEEMIRKIPMGFIEALEKKKGIDMGFDVFGEPYFDEPLGEAVQDKPSTLIASEDYAMLNQFTDAYKAFYGEEEEKDCNKVNPFPITIDEFVQDTFNYYGADNLRNKVEYFQFLYCELYYPKAELNAMMAEEARLIKVEREKTEKSKPIWNALKNS